MMNIVFYAKGFPPCEYGGPVVAAFHLLRDYLRLSSVRITLIVETDCTEEQIHRSLGAPKNLTVIRLRYYPSFHDVRTLPKMVGALRRADLIHFNSFPFRHLVYRMLASIRGIPNVFRVGGLLTEEAESTFGQAYPFTVLVSRGRLRLRFPKGFYRILLGLYRWFAPSWTAVVMNSEALKKLAVRLENFESSRIWIIPNGIDLPPTPPSLPEPHDGALRLLFVGKLERVKGPDLLFSALRLLQDEGVSVDLAVVGTGSLESVLRESVGSLETHRISFHGFRHGSELERLYSWSDIVVVPSRYESFPMVVLETMAARRPLVATSVGGIPEILNDPRNALLTECDAVSIARGIHRLVDDSDLRSAMADANLEDVRQYTWAGVAQRYLSLYATLLNETPSPAGDKAA